MSSTAVTADETEQEPQSLSKGLRVVPWSTSMLCGSCPGILRTERHTEPVLLTGRAKKHHQGAEIWKTHPSLAFLRLAPASCPLVCTNGYLGS